MIMHPLEGKKKKKKKLNVKLTRFQPKSSLWFGLMAGCARCLQSRKTKPRPQEEVLVLFLTFFTFSVFHESVLRRPAKHAVEKRLNISSQAIHFPFRIRTPLDHKINGMQAR